MFIPLITLQLRRKCVCRNSEKINFILMKINTADSHDKVEDVEPRATVSQLPLPDFEYRLPRNCCPVEVFYPFF